MADEEALQTAVMTIIEGMARCCLVRPNAPVNWQQRAQHVDVQLNAQLGWQKLLER
jgi:hypothetical protein